MYAFLNEISIFGAKFMKLSTIFLSQQLVLFVITIQLILDLKYSRI